MDLLSMGKNAKLAASALAQLSAKTKNKVLTDVADALIDCKDKIIAINKKDVAKAKKNGVKEAFIDRLTLTAKRIEDMSKGLRDVAGLNDPVGEYIFNRTLPNGLIIGQKRVPMGVIAIIFEARPNVTADAFGLCFKTGNAVILRGGKEALETNKYLVNIFRNTLKADKMPIDAVQIVSDTDHETAKKLMQMDDYIDLLIPRGSARLINEVTKTSKIPCIQTGVGNCHIFMDESGDIQKAIKIIINAKVQRPGVCNATEKLLVHEKIAEKFLPLIGKELIKNKVEVRCDTKALKLIKGGVKAKAEDWPTEYEDYIIAIKVVKNIDEAIDHINKYGTQHSESIITENYTNSQRFLNEIDAAVVYVNASTRFTDGGEFGFGAEIGISTQKLHARGPMGLKELTTTKYTVLGNGQIRE